MKRWMTRNELCDEIYHWKQEYNQIYVLTQEYHEQLLQLKQEREEIQRLIDRFMRGELE